MADAQLLDREGKGDEAMVAYQRAVDAGVSSAYPYRRLASLMWRKAGNPGPEEMARIAALLGKATALNNRDDYAYSMLGEVRSILGEKDGLGLVHRAISLAPQVADHHLTAARVLSRERNFDEAQKEAQAAMALARTDDEQQRIREFEQWLQRARGGGGR